MLFVKKNIIFVLLCFFVLFNLSGCAPKSNKKILLSQILDKEKKISDDIPTLDKRLKNHYCDELLLRHGYDGTSSDIEYSNICKKDMYDSLFPTDTFSLALSGGGVRSATFSMGVLKSLQEMNLLEKLDSISSVSGGGYTAYWYYMNRYYQYIPEIQDINNSDYSDILNKWENIEESKIVNERLCKKISNNHNENELKSIFSTPFDTSSNNNLLDDYRFQNHLNRQSDMMNYYQSDFLQYLELGGIFVKQTLQTLLLDFPLKKLLNFHLPRETTFQEKYRHGLERTYGLVSNPDYDELKDYFQHEPNSYMNGKKAKYFRWLNNNSAKIVTFKQLRAFNKAYNTCVKVINEKNENEKIKTVHYPMSIPIVNTTASDSCSPPWIKDDKSLEKSIFTFTPLAWGSEYKDYRNDFNNSSPLFVSKAYSASGAAVDNAARETEWYTSIPVEIFNLDLGYDIRNPEYGYKGDDSAWVGMSQFIGFPLKYFISERSCTKLHLSDGGHSENLGAYSLIKRGTSKIIIVDAEHDPNYIFDGLNRLKKKLKKLGLNLECTNEKLCPTAGEFISDKAEHPVFPLEVIGFKDINGKPKKIDILYVKSSINNKKISNPEDSDSECYTGKKELGNFYPCHVSKYYLQERDKDKNKFPQNSTTDLWFDKEQYRALRDLGYYIGMNDLKKAISGWHADIDKKRLKEKLFLNKILRKSKK